MEDGQAHIECSPVSEIRFVHFRIPYKKIRPAEGENALTAASIRLRESTTPYIRAEVVDAQSRRAWTNPIFLDREDLAK